jgi:hypothetical protein
MKWAMTNGHPPMIIHNKKDKNLNNKIRVEWGYFKNVGVKC